MTIKKYFSTALLLLSVASVAILTGCNADDGDTTFVGQLDADGDGINNELDNCPNIANADQADQDEDNVGDVCDDDRDDDGVPNSTDNCPAVFNPDQKNSDPEQDDAVEKIRTGDVCDSLTDSDQDGIANNADTCPFTADPSNLDSNSDGTGDVCEGDKDNDGILDDAFLETCTGGTNTNCNDNCPDDQNADQADSNYDGIGDACYDSVHCAEFGNDLIAIVNPDLATSVAVIGECVSQGPEGSECTVSDPGNTIDSDGDPLSVTDATNFATINITPPGIDSAGSIDISGIPTVLVSDLVLQEGKSEGGKVGFVIETPDTDVLYSLEFANSVTVETFLDDTATGDSTNGAGPQVEFFENTVPPAESPRTLLTISPITQDFNRVKISFSATALSGSDGEPESNASRKVYGACYSISAPPPEGQTATQLDEFINGCYENAPGPEGAEFCDGLALFLGGLPLLADEQDFVAACEYYAAQDDSGQFAGQCSNFAGP